VALPSTLSKSRRKCVRHEPLGHELRDDDSCAEVHDEFGRNHQRHDDEEAHVRIDVEEGTAR
jgi:hypothetical protein